MSCDPDEMVEERINRVLTQYRESPKLLFLLRTYLGAAAAVHSEVCDLPERFDLLTATGDQLTILGKRMGWPRCHCVCDVDPVFGFSCEGEINFRPLTGLCDDNSTWEECESGLSELCLSSDDLYRKFLMVRRYQYLNLYDLASLEECLELLFGPTASVLYSGQGRIVVTPGRDLTQAEILLLQLYPRVLPVALGIRLLFHFGEARVFGFGEGWGGFAEEDLAATQATDAYDRTGGKVFGFCGDQGGFCENWSDGEALRTEWFNEDESEVLIVDESGEPIYTGALTEDAAWLCRTSAPWMCEVDVHPYDC